MAARLPASRQTREELTALIEGRLSTASTKDAGRDEPSRSAIREHLKGHAQGLEVLAIEMLARGLSARDIEDAFKDENGRLLLSKTAVWQLGERLWEDYQAFAARDLSEYEITYLFVDGIAERLRPGAKREPVLAAWGFTIEGRRVLLHMMAGSKEDAETVTAFFEDMKRRGLNDPLLVTSDGAPGIIKAIEVCFPRAARQRCLAHRMRNLAAKVPEDVWPDFKVRAQAAYQAPSRAIARELAAGVVADYGRKYDSAVACFMDDFEACIAHLRFPVTHRRAIRTTNLLERLFVEERRRLKIIPNAFGERAVLKLMFGALIRAAERWRSIKVTEFEHREITAVRKELDQEYEAQVGLIAPKDSDGPTAGARTARLGQVWEAANALAAAQMPRQFSGSTTRSDIDSIDHSSLIPSHNHRLIDPGIAPTAPLHRRIRSRLVARLCLVAVILISGTSVIIAFRQFPLADIWRDHISSWTQLHRLTSTIGSQRAIPRLRAESSRGTSGEPLQLGLMIDGPAEGSVVVITGVLAGMDISTGNEVGAHRWELLPEDVPYAFVAPPEKFVGFVDLVAELRLANDKIVDRQAIYLEWAAPSPPGTAEN